MTMKLNVRYLTKRGGRWQFRRRVPDDLRCIIGKREWVVSLGDVPQGRAIQLAEHHARETENQIIKARATQMHSLTDEGAEEIADRAVERVFARYDDPRDVYRDYNDNYWDVVEAGLTDSERALLAQKVRMSEALERDQRLYPLTHKKHQSIGFKHFIRVNGDVAVEDVTRDQVMAYVHDAQRRGLAPSSIKRRLGALGGVVNRYYIDHDITRRNPFRGVRLANAAATPADREPLSDKQVRMLDDYLKSNNLIKPHTKAVFWLIRCSSLGPSEAGGLVSSDVILDHEVPHVWVRPNELRDLKTKSRIRRFPLVGPALEWAPHLPAQKFGANGVSQRLNKHLKKAVPSLTKKQAVYSLRHRMKDKLYQAGASRDQAIYLMGHSSSAAHDRYGSSIPDLKQLQEIVAKSI
jgi:site-specific recombinase XerD